MAGIGWSAILLLLALGCWRGYRWLVPHKTTDTLFPGTVYRRIVRRTPHPLVVHIVRISLDTPGLHFQVTPRDQKGDLPLKARTTSEFLREAGAQIAINGDFFEPWHASTPWDYYPKSGEGVKVLGRACSEGNWYANSPGRARRPALFLGEDSEAHIGYTPSIEFTPYNVLAGNVIFLLKGEFRRTSDTSRHPRTVVAVDEDNKTLFLVIADGRQQGYSDGATLKELASIIRSIGGDTALNLDGGGSSTLAISTERGSIRVLNRPIQTGIPGRERPVANHLAVFVPGAIE